MTNSATNETQNFLSISEPPRFGARRPRAAGSDHSEESDHMLARGVEADLRPALQRELQVDAARRHVYERAAVVERQVGFGLVAEFGLDLGVGGIDPARGEDLDRLELAVHAVLV